jgi:tetratricopeptide (TPR) repeat protein
MRRALELDPLSTIINNDLGQVLYYAREYEKAIEQLKRTLVLNQDFVVAHFFLALALCSSGKHKSAIAEAEKAVELSGRSDSLTLSCLGATLSIAGEKEEAEKILGELDTLSRERFVSHFWIALINVGLGHVEAAFDSLERAFEEGDHWLETLKVHPMLDDLRSDEGFRRLLKKTGLEDETVG